MFARVKIILSFDVHGLAVSMLDVPNVNDPGSEPSGAGWVAWPRAFGHDAINKAKIFFSRLSNLEKRLRRTWGEIRHSLFVFFIWKAFLAASILWRRCVDGDGRYEWRIQHFHFKAQRGRCALGENTEFHKNAVIPYVVEVHCIFLTVCIFNNKHNKKMFCYKVLLGVK